MSKIAICLYGQPRNYIDGYNVFKKLIEDNSNYSFDFFFHTWYSESVLHYQCSPHRDISEKDLKIQNNIVNTLIELYNPVAYSYDEPKNFDLSQIKQYIAYKNISNEKVRNSINNTLSQVYSRTQVRNNLDKYIKSNNVNYDFVVMVRFDFTKRIPIKFSELKNNVIYYSSIALPRIITVDNLIITSVNIFLKVFDMFDNLENMFNNRLIEQIMLKVNEQYIINPEEVILISIIFNFYKDQNINILQLLQPTNIIPNFI